jgi:hypothetical protein
MTTEVVTRKQRIRSIGANRPTALGVGIGILLGVVATLLGMSINMHALPLLPRAEGARTKAPTKMLLVHEEGGWVSQEQAGGGLCIAAPNAPTEIAVALAKDTGSAQPTEKELEVLEKIHQMTDDMAATIAFWTDLGDKESPHHRSAMQLWYRVKEDGLRCQVEGTHF